MRLKLPEMKTGWIISALVHAALLAWGLISFSARPLEAKPTEALPVDIVSTSEFSQLAQGVKNAPKIETPKPLVDKPGETKPVDEVKPKVVDKPEIKTTASEPEPPPPEPKTKPDAKPDKKPEPKVDPIAEKLKRDEQQRKLAEAKAKAEAKKKPQPPQPKFDANQIAALLDKRDPTRTTATGETPNPLASVGYANAPPAQLSQSELQALRRRLMECWNPPVGAASAGRLKVVFRVAFKPDGSVAAPPELVAGTPSPYGPAMADSARRAILTCQPFNMLKPEHYHLWKDIEITFDPKDMFGG